jgi:phosphotransferase system HPr-like phosphotransfer protein
VSATFHVVETELLASLVGQLLELVRDESADLRDSDDPLAAALGGVGGDEPARPADPVVLRLFPDAYREDDDAAAEFRRFTERGLREQKAGTAAAVLASLATADTEHGDKVKVHLEGEQTEAWLRTLTDLRLALGTRLGVEEGDEEQWAALPDDDPRRHVHDVYQWLGFVQDTLVRAISP